jgi:hypothetical protein
MNGPVFTERWPKQIDSLIPRFTIFRVYHGFTMVLPWFTIKVYHQERWFTQQESLGRVPGVPGSRVDPIARGTGPAPSVSNDIISYHIISYYIIYWIILYYIIYVYTDIYFVYVYVTVHTRVCLKIGCPYTPWFIIMFPIIIPFLGSPESPGWGTGATAAAGGAQRRFALRNMESLRRRLHEENEGGSEFEHFLSREF